MNKRYTVWYFVLVLLVVGCANKGIGPQGGPKDETPPKVLKETPENGALQQHEKNIEIVFDEFIQLDKVSENVLISPPQQRPPEVKAYGKKLFVRFDEDLQDSTTYTIDFGSAICDNNEKNALENYSFAFSTGDRFDTLQISGILLNAEDLNPISGVIVGIHSLLDDTALISKPFDRIGRTNEEGEFTIRNIRGGRYRLWALQDVSRDYLWQAGEGLALYDTVIEPTCRRELVLDTLWRDTATIDTVMTVEQTVYSPQDLTLFFFKEAKQRKYYQRVLREDAHRFKILFAAPQDSMPQVTPLDFDWLQYAICQPNEGKDTITYWLTDSAAISIDTLRFTMRYQRTDSVYQLEWATDTLQAIYRAPRLSERAKAQLAKNKKEIKVKVETNGKSPFEVYNPLQLRTTTPVETIDWDSVRLYEQVDTTLVLLPARWVATDSSQMRYTLDWKWKTATTYELQVDSAAIQDIYGNVNDKMKASFKIRTADEYSSLVVRIEPFTGKERIQLLDEKDKVVRDLPADKQGTRFEWLNPQSYYMRMYIDENGDGQWTTGDYEQHRHPEEVHYFPQKLTLRANWDFEETFRYLALPVNDEKPDAIRKDAASQKK